MTTYPLAFDVLLLIALKGAGNYLEILGFIFPHVYLNSSSCYEFIYVGLLPLLLPPYPDPPTVGI